MYYDRKLDNGIRVVGQYIPAFPSVSVGIWVRTGSVNEGRGENGITHFIEHMLFKGTQKRSAQQIAAEMDDVGGILNAFTSKECTCYHAKVVGDDLEQAVELLSDLVFHSTLDPVELDKEKGVVLEEINMAEDAPEDVVSELIMLARYGDQPLARPILGTQETLTAMTRDQVLDYYRSMYRSDNCVLALAGNYQWDQVVELAQALLGHWMPSGHPLPKYRSAPACPRTLCREKEIEQVHLSLGYPGVAQGSDGLYALAVVNSVFGGAMSSRLFQTIREEKGLAYSVYSYPSSYQDTGVLVVYAGASPQNGEQVLDLIRQEADKLAREGMSQEEFQQAREQLKGGYVLGLESTSSRMNAMGRRLLLMGDTQSEDEVIRRIDSLTYEQVFEAGRQALSAQPALAMVGRGVEQKEG